MNFFFCFWWVSKISLCWQLGQKTAHPQNTIKIWGFSKGFFEKQICVTKRPLLDQKTQNQKFQLSLFFCLFLLLFNNKKHKIVLKPCFIVFQQTKKENFQILNLKHRNLKNPIFAPFFSKKAIFRKDICCEVIIWAKFGHFQSYYLGQVCFLKTLFAKNTIKIGVSTLFFVKKKSVHKNFQSYYLGQVGHFYVATNLAQIITLTWPR